MLEIVEFIAILCTTLFSGAAIRSMSLSLTIRHGWLAGPHWPRPNGGQATRRAAKMQATLAAISTLAAFVSWGLTENYLWFGGAALIFAVIPFTLIVIKPTNDRLLDPALDRASAETHALLEKWGKLHAVRSLLSLLASAVLLIAVLRIN